MRGQLKILYKVIHYFADIMGILLLLAAVLFALR